MFSELPSCGNYEYLRPSAVLSNGSTNGKSDELIGSNLKRSPKNDTYYTPLGKTETYMSLVPVLPPKLPSEYQQLTRSHPSGSRKSQVIKTILPIIPREVKRENVLTPGKSDSSIETHRRKPQNIDLPANQFGTIESPVIKHPHPFKKQVSLNKKLIPLPENLTSDNLPQEIPNTQCAMPMPTISKVESAIYEEIDFLESTARQLLGSRNQTKTEDTFANIVREPVKHPVNKTTMIYPADRKSRTCDVNDDITDVAKHVDIQSLTKADLTQYLRVLKLDKYCAKFEVNDVDGRLLSRLSEADLCEEFGMKRYEALKLLLFVNEGWRPQ